MFLPPPGFSVCCFRGRQRFLACCANPAAGAALLCGFGFYTFAGWRCATRLVKLLSDNYQRVVRRIRLSGLSAQYRKGTTGGFNLGGHGGAGEVYRYVECFGEVAVAEKLHCIAAAFYKAFLAQFVLRYSLTCCEEGLQLAEIDDSNRGLEAGVVKALLRQTTVKGHLATFEAGTNGATGTCLLALVALAAGLAQAGALAAPKALLTMLGARVGLKCLKCQHDGKING